MNRRISQATRAAAFFGAPFLIFGVTPAPAAAADDGNVEVTNTETVQVLMDSAANVETKRVHEQLVLTGKGKADFENPISNNRLRNLDGFGGFDVKDGKQQVDTTVDGSERFRTVSNSSKKLPLDVSVRYYLDGKQASPGDVVGKDGDLEVKYNVKNVSGQTQTVSYKDGNEETIEQEKKVVVPMVGSLTTTTPSSFTDIKSAQANAAGDGRGGTKLSFTMTLFPPIGSDEAEFGYTAKIKDGVVPGASISALPVNPLESPSFKGGAASYKGGADTGIELTGGATQIDTNLLKLRDGASDLLAGLIQLRDGAAELSAGLNDKAVPGAKKIGDGAGKLADGSDQLDSGARRAARGAGDLDDGAKKLNKGAGKLKDGLDTAGSKAPELIGGLKQIKSGLNSVDSGLETLGEEVGGGGKQLRAGIAQLKAGIGNEKTAETLVNGVVTLQTAFADNGLFLPGIDDMLTGVGGAGSALDQLIATFPDADPRKANLVALRAGLVRLAGVTPADKTTLQEGLQKVQGGIKTVVQPGVDRIGCGLTNTFGGCDSSKDGLLEGLAKVDAGVAQLLGGVTAGVGKSSDPSTGKNKSLRGGVNGLSEGNDQIIAGGKTLIEGLSKLGDGAGQLSDGTGALSAGTDKLKDGSGQLADGAGKLSTGAGQLKTGVFTLVDGLVAAAEGSSKLSDGLGTASKGAPKLVDGADKLSEKGANKLIEAGNSTALDYGQKYAVIKAGAERAQTDNMAYGAPDGAQGLTAYTFELAGNNGEGGRNATRGVAALGLFAAGGAVAMLRRRMLA